MNLRAVTSGGGEGRRLHRTSSTILLNFIFFNVRMQHLPPAVAAISVQRGKKKKNQEEAER